MIPAVDKTTGAAFIAVPFFVFGLAFILGLPFSLERYSLGLSLGLLVVVYPVCEELIFRGWLQEHLLRSQLMAKSLVGLTPANLVCSLAFALAHMLYFHSLIACIVFLPSIVFGFFYDRQRSLFIPIILHGWYNFLSFLTIPLW